MPDLTPEGRRTLEDVAQRNGVSLEAVVTLLDALVLGNGTQAQFSHPDLGGMGQWSRGGMIMVGDMFNQGLKYRVDTLCNELSGLLRDQPLFTGRSSSSQSQSQGGNGVSLFVPRSPSSGQWWPNELGAATSTGSQNDLRYAWFARSRRLAIQRDGRVDVYDSGDHRISGFAQQQGGGDQSLTFTSQFGVVRVNELPAVDALGGQPSYPSASAVDHAPPAPIRTVAGPQPARETMAMPGSPPSQPGSGEDIFAKIERLAELHQKGIINDEEFSATKAELLGRI